MSSVSRGYLTIPAGVVTFDEWAVAIADGPEHVEPAVLADWNYYQPIRIRTVVRLDVREVQKALELLDSDTLSAAILWSSSGTALRGRSEIVTLGNEGETPLELVLEPSTLRQQVQIEAAIALRESANAIHPLAPKDPGSLVWSSEKYTLDLEGLGSRLPVVAFPFSKRLPASKAAQWWMHVQSADLELPVDGVLWMWLNDEHPYVRQLLKEPETETSGRTALHLSNDFYRQLLQMAISHEELSDIPYPTGSLGEALFSLVRLVSPDIERLRARYREDPYLVETELQAAVGAQFA